jgi:hypothetical protein
MAVACGHHVANHATAGRNGPRLERFGQREEEHILLIRDRRVRTPCGRLVQRSFSSPQSLFFVIAFSRKALRPNQALIALDAGCRSFDALTACKAMPNDRHHCRDRRHRTDRDERRPNYSSSRFGDAVRYEQADAEGERGSSADDESKGWQRQDEVLHGELHCSGDAKSVLSQGQFNRAIGCQPPPTYLSSDHDLQHRLHQWQTNLRILEVEAIKAVPHPGLDYPGATGSASGRNGIPSLLLRCVNSTGSGEGIADTKV